MNEFYAISENENVDGLELRNLGNQMILAMVGGSRRSGWGERSHSSQTFYRPTTPEDYDHQFVSKLMSFRPIYDLEELLDFHLDNYSRNNNSDRFFKHIKYVVIPLLRKRNGSESQQELLSNWLAKVSEADNLNNQNFELKIGDINSPTQIQINSDNSKQDLHIEYSTDDLSELFKLIIDDLKTIDSSEGDELKVEIKKTEAKINEGKNVKNRLLIIGELMTDIGINVFANLIASPIYDIFKPFLGV